VGISPAAYEKRVQNMLVSVSDLSCDFKFSSSENIFCKITPYSF